MPLIRAAADAPDLTPPDGQALRLENSVEREIDKRWHAARELSHDPAAIAKIAALLEGERDPRVRDALFGSLVDIGGAPAADRLAGFLRSDDAGLRGGAVDSLKRLDTAAVAAIDALLRDDDADVRILAVEVTRAWPSELAVPRLRRVFELEPHVNVCAAAVDVATELGTEDLATPLAGLRGRFEHQPFLVFAVDTACARIHGHVPRGVC
jgi:HEAT repeat protein